MLEENACDKDNTETDSYKAIVAFSDCKDSYKKPVTGCPDKLVITAKEIEDGGALIVESSPPAKEPFNKPVKVPKAGVCMVEISVEPGQNGGFGASEWMDDLYVSLTKLEESEEFDSDTS